MFSKMKWSMRTRWPFHRMHGGAPVDWGSLRRLSPVSRTFGFDRGGPIDRYYIEAFLQQQAEDIKGHVLEVAENTYTHRFGGARVERSDVLHATGVQAEATIIGDLETGRGIPQDAFDCIILTQTFQFVYDVSGAVACCYQALRPGGVLLATIPGISQISRYDMDRWGEYWRFTSLSFRRLLEARFPADNVGVEAYGNVLTAAAFLYGLSARELTRTELEYTDPDYELLITARAVKQATASSNAA